MGAGHSRARGQTRPSQGEDLSVEREGKSDQVEEQRGTGVPGLWAERE